jgi:predicted CXXCH cytochrome family protein
MRNPVRVGSVPAPLLLLAALFLAGCTDEKIVFREPFNPPPDASSGFVGYFTTSDKSTTCGNCHVDHQNKWQGTAHADAYETLVASGSAQDFCYSCHTVNETGNQVETAAGWNVVQDTAYHDVQCESCHGPGADHIETPDASDHPLARVRVLNTDVASGNPDEDNAIVPGSCAECHSGAHHPFVEEWSQSRHARALTEEGIFIADESPSCAPCHEGRSVLKAWGVTSNYFERDSAAGAAGPHFGVTCAVCHDPHNAQFEGQLRYSITDATFEGNLCMKCHTRRYEPAGTSPRGPHAPQGAVLTGTAGFWPPGFDTTAVSATHGNPAANPRLCAGCHVNSFQVTDQLTGGTIFSTGHSFRPLPCLDPATGQPTSDDSCAYDATARYWGACTKSGCHADASAAALALSSQRADIEVLADILWNDADGDEVLYDTLATGEFGAFDAGDTGLLTQIPNPTVEINHKDRIVSIAEGALFNARLVGEDRYANGDRSKGVHNPFLSTQLLAASIQAVQTTYGLGAVKLTPEAKALLDRVNAKLQIRDHRQVSAR